MVKKELSAAQRGREGVSTRGGELAPGGHWPITMDTSSTGPWKSPYCFGHSGELRESVVFGVASVGACAPCAQTLQPLQCGH